MKKEIVNDDNFLCGLILPEYNFEVYLTYTGGSKVKYNSYWNNEPLFAGNDYKPSPLFGQDSLECVISLLGFLTLKEGDTDSDYFKNYTQYQKRWRESDDCTNLASIISDFDDKFFSKKTKRYLKTKFITA